MSPGKWTYFQWLPRASRRLETRIVSTHPTNRGEQLGVDLRLAGASPITRVIHHLLSGMIPQVVSVLKYDSWRNINYRNSWMVAKKQEINNDNHLLMLIPQRLTLIMTRSEHNLVWGLTITRVTSELLTGTEDLLVTFNFATINKPFGSLIYWQMVIFHAKVLNDQKAYGHFWGGCRYWEVLGIYKIIAMTLRCLSLVLHPMPRYNSQEMEGQSQHRPTTQSIEPKWGWVIGFTRFFLW